MMIYVLFKEDEVLEYDLFFLFEGFGIFVLWVVVVEEVFDHDDGVVAYVDPVALYLSIGGDVLEYLG